MEKSEVGSMPVDATSEDLEKSQVILLQVDDIESNVYHNPMSYCQKCLTHRYFILIFICIIPLGGYYCADSPSALQDRVMADLNIDTSTYSAMYAWYTWPNVFLCLFGGYIIDRFGIRVTGIGFCTVTFIGQLIFALGTFLGTLWLMNTGRFIFGIGGELLDVVQSVYAARWFSGKELNMVFGLTLSVARIASTINMNSIRPIYDSIVVAFPGFRGLGLTFLINSFVSILSVLSAVAMVFLERRAEQTKKKRIALHNEKVRISDVGKLSVRHWLICIVCVTFYCAIFPFIAIALKFFETRFHIDPTVGNSINSLIYIISTVVSPIAGLLVDKVGRGLLFVLCSIVGALAAHALLGCTLLTPYIGMSMLGVAYSIMATALWSMVPLVVPDSVLATAYGLMKSIQSAGTASVNIIVGLIIDNIGYTMVEVFFFGCLSVCFTTALVLFVIDHLYYDGHLNWSAKDRKQHGTGKRL